MTDAMKNPKLLGDMLKRSLPASADSEKAVKAAVLEFSQKPIGTKEEQAVAVTRKFELARRYVAEGITAKYASDVSQWGSIDPDLYNAVAKVKSLGLKPSAQEVATAYVGDAVGPEAAARRDHFISIMDAQAKTSDVFGRPDTTSLAREIRAKAVRSLLSSPESKASLDRILARVAMLSPVVATIEGAKAAKGLYNKYAGPTLDGVPVNE